MSQQRQERKEKEMTTSTETLSTPEPALTPAPQPLPFSPNSIHSASPKPDPSELYLKSKALLDSKPPNTKDLDVFIKRNQESGFGFRVLGGEGPDQPVYIGAIVPLGAAEKDGRLRAGDELMCIDGVPVKGKSHKHVLELMTNAARNGQVMLTVRRKLAHAEGSGEEDGGSGQQQVAPALVNGSPKLPRIQVPTASSPHQAECYDVTLQRKDNEGFGFVILTSKNKPPPGVIPHKIGRIIEGSPTDRSGQLKVGDHISAVNSQSIMELSHNDIVQLIKEAGNTVTLTVVPEDENSGPASETSSAKQSPAAQHRAMGQQPASHTDRNGDALEYKSLPPTEMGQLITSDPKQGGFHVELKRGQRGFGFSLRGGKEYNMGLFILRLAEEGPALKDGRIHVGDQIVAINGEPTQGITHTRAIELIQAGGTKVLLLLRPGLGRIPDPSMKEKVNNSPSSFPRLSASNQQSSPTSPSSISLSTSELSRPSSANNSAPEEPSDWDTSAAAAPSPSRLLGPNKARGQQPHHHSQRRANSPNNNTLPKKSDSITSHSDKHANPKRSTEVQAETKERSQSPRKTDRVDRDNKAGSAEHKNGSVEGDLSSERKAHGQREGRKGQDSIIIGTTMTHNMFNSSRMANHNHEKPTLQRHQQHQHHNTNGAKKDSHLQPTLPARKVVRAAVKLDRKKALPPVLPPGLFNFTSLKVAEPKDKIQESKEKHREKELKLKPKKENTEANVKHGVVLYKKKKESHHDENSKTQSLEEYLLRKKKKKRMHREDERGKTIRTYNKEVQTVYGGLTDHSPSARLGPVKEGKLCQPGTGANNNHLPFLSPQDHFIRSSSLQTGSVYGRFIHEERQANGGASVLHAYADELSSLQPGEMEHFAQEFLELAFAESPRGAARYALTVVHRAAAFLPDFLDYFAFNFPSTPVKMEILGKKDIETTTIANFHSQV
ncbi:unnamed protein product [Oncorhynchus mykiss]|uniref:PDZ domain-containing protein n=1 Tax=Oncorhynchus mykiss TaxID=8022 RepID=A0A060YA13_ONCMY|nr:unnamed protein product [Oncorhynchus mykiss]